MRRVFLCGCIGRASSWFVEWALTLKMPAPEFLHPVRAEVSKPFSQSSTRLFDAFRCRSVAAVGDSPFFLLRQNKVSQKKALLSPARTGGGRIRIQVRGALSPLRRLNDAMFLVAACARIYWARGQNCLTKWCAAWFWGSDHNFAAQHPKGEPQARGICAPTPKTPDSDSSSVRAVIPTRSG